MPVRGIGSIRSKNLIAAAGDRIRHQMLTVNMHRRIIIVVQVSTIVVAGVTEKMSNVLIEVRMLLNLVKFLEGSGSLGYNSSSDEVRRAQLFPLFADETTGRDSATALGAEQLEDLFA